MHNKWKECLIFLSVLSGALSHHTASFAQQKPLPQELSRYSAMLDGYAKNPQLIRTLPDSALKADARIMFEAGDRDAGWVEDYGINELEEHDSLLTLYTNGNLTEKPPEIASRLKAPLLHAMASVLTENQMQLVSTPCIVRIRIDSSWQSVNNVPEAPSLKVEETDLIVTVENVLKGAGMFSPGQTIKLYYMNFWHVPPLGSDAVIFLSPRSDFDITGQRRISLDGPGGAYLGDRAVYRGVYPVVNGILIDPNNDWGLGEKVQWSVFKNQLDREMTNIRSW